MRPWSVTNFDPEPFRVITCVVYTRITVSAVISSIAKASTYFEKLSMNVSKWGSHIEVGDVH
jgi:hypothetical protein